MIEEIEKTVMWYSTIPRDFCDVHTLMSARRKLSCLLASVASELAALYAQKNGTEFLRKARHSEVLRREMGVEKTTAAAARIIADNEIIIEQEREFTADSEYKRAAILYDAWRNVCDTMSQHISNLKAERGAEMRGIGGQTT